jgi:hypothetical protein
VGGATWGVVASILDESKTLGRGTLSVRGLRHVISHSTHHSGVFCGSSTVTTLRLGSTKVRGGPLS